MLLAKNSYKDGIIMHCENIWQSKCSIHTWGKGPINKLPSEFGILEFPPTSNRDMWTYLTCCMSQPNDQIGLELHLFSSIQDLKLVELLTTVAYFHRNTESLGLRHTVNFGMPWQNSSQCSFGLISLPYLDGPELENFKIKKNKVLKFYWLIPITQKEVEYKMQNGVEALEAKLEENAFNYTNTKRISVV